MTSATHSTPPAVTVDAAGRDLDIPVITLDLEGGAIARSMVRSLARALVLGSVTHWLRIAAVRNSADAETYIDRVVGAARGHNTFQPQLDLDAAKALHEELGRAIDLAESTCRRDGCNAIGLLDGLCAPHDEALDLRRIGA